MYHHVKKLMYTVHVDNPDPRFGNMLLEPPTAGVVDEYYNDSTGQGDDGEIDARGPWNEGGDWQFIDSPAFAQGDMATARTSQRSTYFGVLKQRPSK